MLVTLKTLRNLSRWIKKMLIVGIVNSQQESIEIQGIFKRFVVGNRARFLGKQSRK